MSFSKRIDYWWSCSLTMVCWYTVTACTSLFPPRSLEHATSSGTKKAFSHSLGNKGVGGMVPEMLAAATSQAMAS